MKAIREAAGQDLQWKGKKAGFFAEDEFELRSGDEVLALLHAREKGTDWICGEAADGRWALQSRNIESGMMSETGLTVMADRSFTFNEDTMW